MNFWDEWRNKDVIDRAEHLKDVAKSVRKWIKVLDKMELPETIKNELLAKTLNDYFEDLDQTEKEERMGFVVFRDIDYYPYVEGEYATIEGAQKEYGIYLKDAAYHQGRLFLCKVIDKKDFEQLDGEIK